MKSNSTALFVALFLAVWVNPHALAERHLSPAILNEKLLLSVPPQSVIKTKTTQGKSRDQRSSSSFADFRRVLSSSKSKVPIPGTISALVTAANVVATICPHGMLPLVFGMAAARSSGQIVACTIVLIFGLLAWYSLVSFARAAEVVLVQGRSPMTDQSSIAAVWERTIPNGQATTFIPDIGCIGLTAGCLLVHSSYIGDLAASLTSHVEKFPLLLKKRWSVSMLLHGTSILPLCLFHDQLLLTYASFPGLVGIAYVLIFVVKRFLDKSYHNTGTYFGHLQPVTSLTGSATIDSGKGLFVLMTMSSLAYACHYNGVKYYMELKHRELPNLRKTMAIGIVGSAVLFIAIMLLSNATFGQTTQVLLMKHYHPTKDSLATIARVLILMALISGYSLVFDSLKTSLFSLLKLGDSSEAVRMSQRRVATCILLLIAVVSCFVTDQAIATVIGIVGSIFGSVVVYIFPALLNSSLFKMTDRYGNTLIKPLFPGEALFNQGLFAFGVVFAALGSRLLTHPEANFRI